MWQPNLQGVQKICQMFNSSRIADNIQQQEIYKEFEIYRQNDEFILYLAYILAEKQQIPIDIRQIAGISMKTIIARNYDQLPEQNKQYLKQKLMESFVDEHYNIRRTTSIIITSIITKAGFTSWPELLEFMIQNLNSDNSTIIENTIDCISKIVEDLRVNSENYSYLDTSQGSQQLDVLIPKLIEFCDVKYKPNIQASAMLCLNLCIFSMPPALTQLMPQYIQILLSLSIYSNDNNVRLRCVQGIVSINETRKDLLLNFQKQVLEIMIKLTGDTNYEIAKNAALFWPEYFTIDTDLDEDILRKENFRYYIKDFLPIIMDGLIYSQEDIMNMLPSQDKGGKVKNSLNIDNYYDDEDLQLDQFGNPQNDNKEDENQEEKDLFDHGEFTLRRICGQTLQKISSLYRDECFEILKTKIDVSLQNQSDWKRREVAILTLGTLADSCYDQIQPTLQILIPFLLKTMRDQEPLIRSISCWTISQYTFYISEYAQEIVDFNTNQNLMQFYLKSLTECVIDKDKTVQEASCTAFQKLIRNSALLLIDYITDVLYVFNQALGQYQGPSLYTLYGAIADIAEALEDQLKNKPIIDLMVPPLVQKFLEIPIDDKGICPLLECLCSIANALEEHFIEYTQQLIPKTLLLVHNYVFTLQQQDKKNEYLKREIFLRAADLLSSILNCTLQNFQLLLENQQINLYEQLIFLMEDQDFQVRQFVFSLFGEIAKGCPNKFKQYVPQILPFLSKNMTLFPDELDPGKQYMALCNNVIYCLGEFCVSYPDLMGQHVFPIAEQIIQFLNTPKINKTLAINFSKTLGRIGQIDPVNLASKIQNFIKPFCISLRVSSESQDKIEALRGFLMILQYVQQENLHENEIFVIEVFASLEKPTEDIKQAFNKLLVLLQQNTDQNRWNQILQHLSQPVLNKLQQTYNF